MTNTTIAIVSSSLMISLIMTQPEMQNQFNTSPKSFEIKCRCSNMIWFMRKHWPWRGAFSGNNYCSITARYFHKSVISEMIRLKTEWGDENVYHVKTWHLKYLSVSCGLIYTFLNWRHSSLVSQGRWGQYPFSSSLHSTSSQVSISSLLERLTSLLKL